jgi:predicted alpha/beta superfamily hydrolase
VTAIPFILQNTDCFQLRSPSGLDYKISVALPLSYAHTDVSYPVLYVLDADVLFGTFCELTRMRGALQEIDELVVVGVGYPDGTDFATWVQRRTHDFSAATWQEDSPSRQGVAGVLSAMGKEMRVGGADDFLDFLTGDVQHLVTSRYRVIADDQGLFGDSAAGNLVGQSLFRRPQPFSKFILNSPAFAINDGLVHRLEEDFATQHQDLPAVVYMSAGSSEMFHLAGGGIVSGTTRLAESLQLRGYSGLRLQCDVLPSETHITAITDGLQRGLTACWPGQPLELNASRSEHLARNVKGSSG